jgi:hypothetical protein
MQGEKKKWIEDSYHSELKKKERKMTFKEMFL